MKTILLIICVLISSHLFANEIDFLKTLSNISSGTNQLKAVNSVQDLVEARLKKMGFTIERQIDPDKKSGDLILAMIEGKEKKVITLIVHADTVFEPEANFSEFKLLEDKNWAQGPGVIDNKGGIVVMLQGLEDYLKDHPKPRYTLRVLSSPNEEVGSAPFVKNFKRYGEESSLVLSFEPSLDDGSIVTSRRGNRWFHIQTLGREAHAGRAFKDGVNACVELGILGTKISQLTDFKKDLTLNIGRIDGGQDKFNIVCGKAHMKVDTRFSSVKVRDGMQKNIDLIVRESNARQLKRGIKDATTYEIVDDSPPYGPERNTEKYVALYTKEIEKIEERKVAAKSSGASADANYLGRPDLVILDGLGPTGKDMHTLTEAIYLPSLSTRAKAFTEFLKKVEL